MKQSEIRNIPIFIVSFNRLEYLQKQISVFEKYGLTNIHIVDNASTYPPLLEYLSKTQHKVHYMSENIGHLVVFKAPEFKEITSKSYFVVTDPDILPIEDCPDDFLELFYDILRKHRNVSKVGFSLKVDDIPDHYVLKSQLLRWESIFYRNEDYYKKQIIYHAPIDTTFALYRPQKKIKENFDFYQAIRVGYPYEARHLPWYSDLDNPTDEDIFYNKEDKNIGNWNGNLSEEALMNKQKINMGYCSEHFLFSFISFFLIEMKPNAIRVLFMKFPLFQQKLTKSGQWRVKICKLPIPSFLLNLKKGNEDV